jgi:hypothetical protein
MTSTGKSIEMKNPTPEIFRVQYTRSVRLDPCDVQVIDSYHHDEKVARVHREGSKPNVLPSIPTNKTRVSER